MIRAAKLRRLNTGNCRQFQFESQVFIILLLFDHGITKVKHFVIISRERISLYCKSLFTKIHEN